MGPSNDSQSTRWVIAQRWSHVQFLSFRSDLEAIKNLLPAELEVDLLDGSTWLSGIIYIPLMALPCIVEMWRMNLGD